MKRGGRVRFRPRHGPFGPVCAACSWTASEVCSGRFVRLVRGSSCAIFFGRAHAARPGGSMRSVRGLFLWSVREACAVCAGRCMVARPVRAGWARAVCAARPGGSLRLAPSVLSRPVLSCPVRSCSRPAPVLSRPVPSRPVLSRPIPSRPVLSCPVLLRFAPFCSVLPRLPRSLPDFPWAPEVPLSASPFTPSSSLCASRLRPNARTTHTLEGHADSGWLPPSVHAPEAGLQSLPDAPGGNAGNELIFPALNDCV